MAFNLFGFTISKDKKAASQEGNKFQDPIPVTPTEDGITVYNTTSSFNSAMMSGYFGYAYDIDGSVRNENNLITRYRNIASYSETDQAIEQIVNEAVIVETSKKPVAINLDRLPEEYKPIAEKIEEHFDKILQVLNFNESCHDIFKRWYVDGRLYYFVIIDSKNPKNGIVDLKYIDPRKIKLVHEYTRKKNDDGIDVIVGEQDFFIFNDAGLQSAQSGIKINPDNIIYVKSGLVDANTGEVLSYLFKAIKPTNQLKMMEDALVIYRITRAPERRVFYIDVGNLQKSKAEQYVAEIMNRFRNKIVYDSTTGEVKNNRNYMSMMEDLWLPRREGGRSTEISTLPAGCLALDTKVQLIDGRQLTILECEEQLKQGNTLVTYSCEPNTGRIVPGLVSWAGITQKDASVIRIDFSNKTHVVCTHDHKFPVIGKGAVRADQLSVNDQIITLHTRVNNRTTQVYDEKCQDWVDVDQLVFDFLEEDLPLRKQNEVNNNMCCGLSVTNIERLDQRIDVGTLTIDFEEKYHDYHTFSLANGVFTFNSNLSEIADVEYFQRKLYQALNVPKQRLLPDNVYNHGTTNEITREEITFAKFIQRLRNHFNALFRQALRIQLLVTRTINEKDWRAINNAIFFEYQRDNYYEELKRIEVFNERMTQLQTADTFVDKYFSKEYIVKEILGMSDEDWKTMQQQIQQEHVQEQIDDIEFTGSDEDLNQNSDQISNEDNLDTEDNIELGGEDIKQSGDVTDTINDDQQPSNDDDDFSKPAQPGLVVARR